MLITLVILSKYKLNIGTTIRGIFFSTTPKQAPHRMIPKSHWRLSSEIRQLFPVKKFLVNVHVDVLSFAGRRLTEQSAQFRRSQLYDKGIYLARRIKMIRFEGPYNGMKQLRLV